MEPSGPLQAYNGLLYLFYSVQHLSQYLACYLNVSHESMYISFLSLTFHIHTDLLKLWGLRSSGLFLADVSGEPIGPIFKLQESKKEAELWWLFGKSSAPPGRGVSVATASCYGGAKYFCVFSMELASFHPSGACNFEVALRVLGNWCIWLL
jgi:hypothetical protein